MKNILRIGKNEITRFKFFSLLHKITLSAQSNNPAHQLLKVEEGGLIIATDSKRLATYKCEGLDLKPGLYEIIKDKNRFILVEKETVLKFPDYKRVMDKSAASEEKVLKTPDIFSKFVAGMLNSPSFRLCLDIDFLKDIFQVLDPAFKVYYKNSNYPVLIDSGPIEYLIMPIN